VTYGTVLVGTDGSITAGRAVRRAVDISAHFGARLLVAYVGEAALGIEVLEGVERQYAEAGIRIVTSLLTGDAADALLGLAAAERVDLVVVGNRGMSGPQRLLLGSVPDKLIRRSTCDVLVVRTTSGTGSGGDR